MRRVLGLNLTAWHAAFRVNGRIVVKDHAGQRQRTREAPLSEQPLRTHAPARAPRLISAALENNLPPISKPHAHHLRQMRDREQNLDRRSAENVVAPAIRPRG